MGKDVADVRCYFGSLRAKEEGRNEKKVVSFQSILLAMDAPNRRANVRVHVSKNPHPTNYPRGALIMVAGAGGGNEKDFRYMQYIRFFLLGYTGPGVSDCLGGKREVLYCFE